MCGVGPMTWTREASRPHSLGSTSPHPGWTTTRLPASPSTTARSSDAVPAMLPNPTYTGGSPASRNAARSGGGAHSGSSRCQSPQTATLDRQSAGVGRSAGEYPKSTGTSFHTARNRPRPRRRRARATGRHQTADIIPVATWWVRRLRRAGGTPGVTSEGNARVGARGKAAAAANRTPWPSAAVCAAHTVRPLPTTTSGRCSSIAASMVATHRSVWARAMSPKNASPASPPSRVARARASSARPPLSWARKSASSSR